MESTESKLYVAALEGNTTTLRELLEQDRLILDRLTFMNQLSHKTLLHVAACLGHADFVKEILCRKPELAGELDSRQSSPLHVASLKGYADIVRALLKVNPDMCLARDVDGRNPLHLAAMKGRIDVLEELVRVRPLAASATTLCGETILHLCVKYQQFEALKFLLENENELHQLLNSKDDYGMTILHLAVADKQIEAIQLILKIGKRKIEVNSLNANGFTALGILALSKRDEKISEIEKIAEIERLLRKAKPIIVMKQGDWLENMRNAILMASSIIATVAFQVAVNPPRILSEDEPRSPSEVAAAPDYNKSFTTGHNRIWIAKSFFDLKRTFTLFNTIAFLASVSTMLMLISGLPLNRKDVMWVLLIIMWAAITAMIFTYMMALNVLYDCHYCLYLSPASSNIVFTWMCVVGLLLLIHFIRVTIKFRSCLRDLKVVLFKKPTGRSLSPTISSNKEVSAETPRTGRSLSLTISSNNQVCVKKIHGMSPV